jgi:hypothetical protein
MNKINNIAENSKKIFRKEIRGFFVYVLAMLYPIESPKNY